MIYFDTSALAKKYLKREKGRQKVLENLEANPGRLVSSALTQLEVVSALTRRRSDISGYERAVEVFNRDWETFIVWAIDEELIAIAVDLIKVHRLKAADSVHLATALSIQRHIKERLILVSSDQELLTAANKEGLFVSDPEVE
jgi:predicted nucleic acid-binding protein